jgi:hypothetical protein
VAKIFYCGGLSGRLGTLRSVTPLSDLSGLLSMETSNYVGQSFPQLRQDSSPCIVIQIAPDEEEEHWRPGFYCVEKSPIQFEATLRTLSMIASNARMAR